MNLRYLNGHLSQGFVALFTGRMLMFVGMEMVGLFLPIFLLSKLDNSVERVFWYFLIGYLAYVLLLPIGAQFLNLVGLRRSIRISVFLHVAFYVCLYLWDANPQFFWYASILFLTFYRMLFWVPYHTDFAKFTDVHDRGKEVSMIWITKSVLSVVMPVVAALLIKYFDFNMVFIIAIIIFLSVYIPFMSLPRTRERYSWGVMKTLKEFFSLKNRRVVLANMANGAESKIGLIIWPMFIFQIFNGNFLKVGLVSSLIIFISIILQVLVGKYTDIIDKRKMLHWGSTFYALGWIAKIFVLTTGQVFVIGAYHSLAKIFKDTPFDTLNYEMMADHGHYVDEFTVLKEMAITIGGIIVLGVAIIIAASFGLNWTFILAALASVLVNLL